eukprot:2600223-Pyramimonas_sp.AAC.3
MGTLFVEYRLLGREIRGEGPRGRCDQVPYIGAEPDARVRSTTRLKRESRRECESFTRQIRVRRGSRKVCVPWTRRLQCVCRPE